MTPQEAVLRRRRPLLAVFLGLFFVLFIGYGVIVAVISAIGGAPSVGPRLGHDRIGVITVSGIITSSSTTSLFGGTLGAGANRLIEQIRAAASDDSVRAVVVRIDSPGGTAAASQELYEAVLAARERKPFIASMGNVAASGGYYVAAACDRIVANRATTTGSIGVMMPGYDISGLLEWARVKPNVVKSAKYKDIGSPDRPMTSEERQLLQDLVDNTFQQFLGDVARGRKVKVETIRPWADGRILTGELAKKAGLIDDLGGFYDAVRIAREAAGLPPTDHPNLHYYGRTSLLDQLLQADAVLPPTHATMPPSGLLPRVLPPLWFLAPVGGLRLTAGS